MLLSRNIPGALAYGETGGDAFAFSGIWQPYIGRGRFLGAEKDVREKYGHLLAALYCLQQKHKKLLSDSDSKAEHLTAVFRTALDGFHPAANALYLLLTKRNRQFATAEKALLASGIFMLLTRLRGPTFEDLSPTGAGGTFYLENSIATPLKSYTDFLKNQFHPLKIPNQSIEVILVCALKA